MICPDLQRFYADHGRLPHLGDPQAPWTFRGWALPYLLEGEAQLGLPPRWDYYLKTVEAGRLLPDPIPQIAFNDTPHPSVMRAIEQWISIIAAHHSHWNAFQELVRWSAWALGVSHTPSKLDKRTLEQLYREVNFLLLLQHPHDAFGTVLATTHSNGFNPSGFFPTPHSIARLMVHLTTASSPTTKDLRLHTVHDPALGTGRFLLEASNFSLLLSGTDIDPFVLSIAKINGALYAPWLSFPLPHALQPHAP
jgi:hypothetical protein